MNNYKKNISALKKYIPDIAAWIEKQEDVEWIKPIKCKNGKDNLLIFKEGKSYPIYNMDDPIPDVEKYLEGRELFKQDISVLIGFGLGYMTKAVIDKMEKGHTIVVVEPVGHIIKLALSQFDFSKYIKNGQLIIATPGIEEVNIALAVCDSRVVVRQWYATTEHYIMLRKEYAEVSVKTLEIINSLRCNTGTVAANGGIIANNDIESLPYLIRHRGVIELLNIFKGKPAVTVSTGPSLQKNIHHLIEHQDKVVIVAVGQALRPLLAYGIRPDFICTVDFGEVNMGHFNGILESDVPLICLNRAYAPLLKKYQGPKFVVATPNPGYEDTAIDIMRHRGSVDQYGSVAHLCLGVAHLMGCDPIIMIGQDLAYPDKNITSHFSQADEAGNIKIDEQGTILWDVTDKKSILHGKGDYSHGQFIEVPGYFGKPVKTNVGLASFISGFENQVKGMV